jgi:hypothetical protein
MSNFYAGDIYYLAVILCSATFLVTLLCAAVELKFSRNKWYLAINLLVAVLNVIMIAEISMRRFALVEKALQIRAIDFTIFIIAPFQFLLVIQQQSTILNYFSFLDSNLVRKVTMFWKIFFAVFVPFFVVHTGVATYYFYYNSADPQFIQKLVLNSDIRRWNTCAAAIFAFGQSFIQNYWITTRVYNMGKITGSHNPVVFKELLIILGTVVFVDVFGCSLYAYGIAKNLLLELNPFLLTLMGIKVSILTLSQTKLKNVIKHGPAPKIAIESSLISEGATLKMTSGVSTSML